jgi:hypothetical protein
MFGFRQPTFGSTSSVTFSVMGRPAKPPKAPALSRGIVAANLVKLLDKAYPGMKLTPQQKKLEKDSNGALPFTTTQRLMKAGNGANLETLETYAIHFGLQMYQLFLPNLDVKNPQVVKGAHLAEQRLYASISKARVGAGKTAELQGSPQ